MWSLVSLLLATSVAAFSVCPALPTALCRVSDGTVPWSDIVDYKIAHRESLLATEYLLPLDLVPPEDVTDVSNFARSSGVFTPEELKITESTATTVITKIAHGQWTAVEVLEATIKRTVVAHRLFNPLSEVLFDRGRATARRLDAYYKKHKKTIGPLHGLPMSMKDTFRFKGHDTTIGYVSLCGKPDDEDSLLVTALENLGAVLYTKTNVVTALMGDESINNIYNATKNPFNLKLTPGGSSGGESALIAFKGSFTGISTDVAGSIRAPAINTGLYGIRPSIGRCSTQNMRDGMPGQEAVGLTCGPMARTVSDLHLVFSSLVSQELWKKDPVVLPIPWRYEEEELPDRLSFAWANGDNSVRPWPPIQRAMHITRKKLEAQGHEVIEWVPPDWPAVDIVGRLLKADAGISIQKDFNSSGEPPLEILKPFLTYVPPEDRTTVYDAWQMVYHRQTYSNLYKKAWLDTVKLTSTGRPFDALIMPSTPYPAKERDTRFKYTYTGFSPMLDLTAGAFPVTRVEPTDIVNASFVNLTREDKDIQDRYDGPTRWENAPVGLELIGQRLEEEKVIALLGVIEDALKK